MRRKIDRCGKTFYLKSPVNPYFTSKYRMGVPTPFMPIAIEIEDRDTKVFGGSWGAQVRNPACIMFALRQTVSEASLNLRSPVWYGKIEGLGELIFDDELGEEVVSQ